MKDTEAILNSNGNYTFFYYGNRRVKFRTANGLEYYSQIKEWDNGYIVVSAKYDHNAELEDEYIDLEPIFKNLGIETSVLKRIKKVRVDYEYSGACE